MEKKIKDKLFFKISLVLILMFIMVTGLWAIDIGVSGMLVGRDVEGLFGVRKAVTQYHIGLGLSMTAFVILNLLYLYQLLKNL